MICSDMHLHRQNKDIRHQTQDRHEQKHDNRHLTMDIEYLCPSVTSLDALESKISSVLVGYFDDPYLRRLSEHLHHNRKMPIINRGYYNRVKCIGDVVDSFLSLCAKDKRVQLVNLGAGMTL